MIPVRPILGDSREVLPTLDADSFDSCVTDPPYALTSIVKRFGGDNAAPAKSNGASGVYARAASGFMGQKWDTGETAFDPAFWAEVLRVLKPGAHLLACGGTRTYHRLACAIEDAGFEIRDAVMWHYGSGFPKSHDVSKGIDRAAGAEREVVGEHNNPAGNKPGGNSFNMSVVGMPDHAYITAPATDAAREWQGWGTALKPATEIIVLARKPLSEKTVAANCLRWGTGALNIDACRVGTDAGWSYPNGRGGQGWHGRESLSHNVTEPMAATAGRWPANLIHDGSEEVLAGFPETGATPGSYDAQAGPKTRNVYGPSGWREDFTWRSGHAGPAGNAARFFYTAKADADDRCGSKHPTVKPPDLMAYLIRLVTRKGGLVLDPFAGTGTTGEAAIREGCRAVLIEREPTYYADIERRLKLAMAGPQERSRAIVKASGQLNDDPGPLFGGDAGGGQHKGRSIYGEFADDGGRRRAARLDRRG